MLKIKNIKLYIKVKSDIVLNWNTVYFSRTKHKPGMDDL